MKLDILNNDESNGQGKPARRLPPWLKRPMPQGGTLGMTRDVVAASGVATVCREAHCPNLSECWSHKTATFMILGDRCTRRCHYCAVNTARPEPINPQEPHDLAEAVAQLGIRHAVITAVARDDLPDEGAGQFAECVRQVHHHNPQTTVEVLPADLHARKELLATICQAGPDVFNHNIETVERLTPIVRPQGKYRRSLDTLRIVKEIDREMVTKSGLMVGLGESQDEIKQTLADLRGQGCQIVTIGQYLAPSSDHTPIAKFYHPDEFSELESVAYQLGFATVASGPFVRSSYHAGAVYKELKSKRQPNSS